ncbi:MAG: hypothetical protein KGY70_10185 [Bacteroidales bacterium]|nr:hypothetical protein [Bacteroidales bacterium]
MKIKILLATALSLLVMFTACNEDEETGNNQVTLKFQAVHVADMLKATNNTLEFDSAMVGIREIEIESDDDDDGTEEREYEFEGPYQLNLLTGTTLSEIIAIEPGIYHELEAEIEPVPEDGHSVYIEARYTNADGKVFPVVFHTTESIDFEVENEQGIQINDQDIKNLLIRIDLNALFGSIDLDGAYIDDSGTILINENYNENLADQLEDYLDDHSEFEEDDDDDDDDNDDDDDDDEDDDDDDDDDDNDDDDDDDD